jgi:hypothetical protein
MGGGEAVYIIMAMYVTYVKPIITGEEKRDM